MKTLFLGLLIFAPTCFAAGPAEKSPSELASTIGDAEIRAGVEAAVFKNLLPAATEQDYPGYFNICADGRAYGGATWPGLDSWQMAGAYLLLGRTRLVLDYFEFVRASQRKDGNIPFAIFTGDTKPGGCLRGLKSPEDIFTYHPPKREGVPASSQETRRWIGLFEHWQTKGYPLGALGPVCYLLTGAEIFDATKSVPWLKERLGTLEAAARYLLTLKKTNGLIGGSGFYIELPPREGCDGVTQCYTIHAFRELARLFRAAGESAKADQWNAQADKLTKTFVDGLLARGSFRRVRPPGAWAGGFARPVRRELGGGGVRRRDGREAWLGVGPVDEGAGLLAGRHAHPQRDQTVQLREVGNQRGAGLRGRRAQRRGGYGPGLVSGSRRLPAHESV